MKQQLKTWSSYIEEAIKAARFEKALESLNAVDTSALNRDEAAYHSLLHSEALLYLGDYDILTAILATVDYYKTNKANDRYAKSKFLLGWLYCSTGRMDDAKEALIEAYAAYKRCEDMEGAARALNQLSYISQVSGEMDNAIDHLKKGIDLYRQIGKSESAIYLRNNLRSVLLTSGKFRELLETCEDDDFLIRTISTQCLGNFLLFKGIASGIRGNIIIAADIIGSVESLTKGERRKYILYLEYLGWLYNVAGKYAEAENILLKAQEEAVNQTNISDMVSQTKRLLADTYLGLKQYDLAQKFADEALVVAEKINERAEIAACYRVFAQTALHRGENETARDMVPESDRPFRPYHQPL